MASSKTFSNDLAISIATALDSKLDQRLGDHIGPLTRAVEQFAASMTTQNQDTVSNMLDAFLQKLHLGAGDKMQETIARMAESANAGADAGQDMATRIEQAASGFETAARTIADTLTQAAHGLQTRMTEEAESGCSCQSARG